MHDEYIFKGSLGANGLPEVSPDNLKMILLKSAVFHIPDLCSVDLTQTQLSTCLISTASFHWYLALLVSVAIQYDKACQTTPHANLKNAVSLYHNQLRSDIGLYYDE